MSNYKHIIWIFIFLLGGCSKPWNSPYPAEERFNNTVYSSFADRPKHLDPARSYSANEWIFIQSVYETPLQYHYLKRPYELIPGVLEEMPQVVYLSSDGSILDKSQRSEAKFTEYRLKIKQGIRYQDHPAFVEDNYKLSEKQLNNISDLRDFKKTDSRELTANDFVYQIKRLANPRLSSPIFSLMSEYIVGLNKLNKQLKDVPKDLPLNLNNYELEGAKATSRYDYTIKINGINEQFMFWLAMPFFAPVPSEADVFYAQDGLIKKNIIMDWYPVGTGPYMLTVNNPNKEMILDRNPNFHGELYPNSGEVSDDKNNLLVDSGRELPFVDRIHFMLEKESTPYWQKFIQGYYDRSGIASDNFDQAIQVIGKGQTELSDYMKGKNIRLITSDSTSVYYTAFNMRDSIVGGYSEEKQKLRQAISIAINEEEYISIFRNGRGSPAHGPIPPGIFGNKNDFNPYVYEMIDGNVVRKSIEQANQLMNEAGYPGGIDTSTGKPLVLYFDTTASSADDQPRLDWIRKQFKKIGIQLVVRPTNYNRLQEKMRKGQIQIFELGWNADYPDPENFLFLLYGKNSKVESGGENGSNYQNSEFDQLFDQMKNMPNTSERQKVIDQMVEILRKDSPWIWGFIPKSYGLYHEWLQNAKPNAMARNTLKYLKINPELRDAYRQRNNEFVWWPILIVIVGIFFVVRRIAGHSAK